MLKISGVVLCEIMIYTLLKQYKPEFAVISEAASLVLLLFLLGDEIKNAISSFSFFFDSSGLSAEYTAILLKVLGIAVITQFTSDMCKDSGENALSSKVEFAGKIIITATSIPVIEGFTGLVAQLVGSV